MAKSLLIKLDYPQVRAAIGTDIDENALPDRVIAMSIYQGAAERWLRGLDDQVETRLEDPAHPQRDQIIGALCLKTASLVVRALPFLVEEKFNAGEGYTRQQVDPGKLAAELAQRAQAEAAEYLATTGITITATTSGVNHFTLARGRRGR